jgi:arthrofactin-type cyclic lipopeptide synthetase C
MKAESTISVTAVEILREQHMAFFRTMLADLPQRIAPFGLSITTSGGAEDRGAEDRVAEQSIPRDIIARLRGRAIALGVTTGTLVHVALALVLARASGCRDVVFGTVIRCDGGEVKTGDSNGNLLPIRIVIDTQGVDACVSRVHRTLLNLAAHREAPLALAAQCSPLGTEEALFEAILDYQPGRIVTAGESPTGARHEPPSFPLHNIITPRHWLKVGVEDQEDGMHIVVATNSSVSPSRVGEMLCQAFNSLLEALERDLSAPMAHLEVLSKEERRTVLFDWNRTAADHSADRCVHEMVEACTALTPNAIAISTESEILTYDELNRRANRCASVLRARGARRGEYIPIVMERSADMLVCQLAVLKAGCAYVPVDPTLPEARRTFVIRDCRPTLVIGNPSVTSSGDSADTRTISWGDLKRESEGHGDENLGVPLKSDAAAYVMYTSGSTGTPKGVIVPHRGVNRLVLNNWYASIEQSDCFAHCSNPAFDASTFEIWGALLNGARVFVVPQACVLQPELFAKSLVDNGVTILWLTAALLNQYFDSMRDVFRRLKYLLAGGEPLDPRVLRRVLRESPPACCVNGYGPTECTTFSTAFPILEVAPDADSVSIGRPIANTCIYILNEFLEPVPIGVIGELYVGGAGVALGYLNQPALTAERFVANPFVAEDRLYKTGDLGRFRSDGNIDYMGRNDLQVKMRGFRVELSEIELRLASYPGVREAVVLAREGDGTEKQLVAYLTMIPGVVSLAPKALRNHLSAVLPEYMLPAAYVRLDRFPLTPNGKLDRKGLPAPANDDYASRAYEEPVGEFEQRLARLWAQLLKLERVGRGDHFFELGGHSLLAVTMVTRMRNELGREVAIKELFAEPVLARFAQVVRAADAYEHLPIIAAPRSEVLPLSFAQQRLWFLAQIEGGSEAYHIPIGLHLRGPLNRVALQLALDRLVWRHEALRTCFRCSGEVPTQHIAAPDVGFALRELDLSDKVHQLEQQLIEEARQPFDLERGPLIRGLLFRLAEQEHVLSLTMHHIVSDGWSMAILTGEISQLYGAYVANAQDPLPPLALQYADYAVWQCQWFKGSILEGQRSYWQELLAGAPVMLELPTDRPRPAQQVYAGERLEVRWDGHLAKRLKAFSQRQGVTSYMTVLAAWAVVLSRLSGQDEVVIGSPTANRTRAEVEGLIGFFVNTLALRIVVSGTVTQLLGHVRERALEAQAHQDLPFEQVVDLLKTPRSLVHTPIFQVVLAWQNNERRRWELSGLSASEFEVADGVAKFDLTLELSETEEGVVGGLSYATALFDRATIERHIDYLRRTLEAMLQDEQQPLARIDLLSEAERHRLTVEWGARSSTAPLDRGIHEIFKIQATSRPQAIAVVHGAQQLSYGDLEAQSNRLANYLRLHGVNVGTRVALCAERSLAMVVGILATLKAGGVYVPLDPSYPLRRLAYLLDDSAPALVLTQGSGRAILRSMVGAWRVVDLQEDSSAWAASADSPPDYPAGRVGESPAYLMYTSGSTGMPKGVEVLHRAAIRVVVDNGYADFEPTDRVAFAANPAFDASTLELWAPLLNGGTLVVIEQAVLLEPERFASTLIEQAVSVLWLTAGLFNEYVEALRKVIPRLRYLIVGGDVLDPIVIGRVLREYPPQHLLNGYGPTETTTFATTYEITTVADGAKRIPIGRPIGNTRVYILDQQLRAVPIGAAGELYIGGVGVAVGYWKRPELTEERFIASPFVEGDRLYKTGDLGRFRSDGNIDYLGRNDHQVKIRGFRIELGEIEGQLREYPGVRDVVVLARSQVGSRDVRLVAYYTLDVPDSISAPPRSQALRNFLSGLFPEYMVPAAYVWLASVPLNVNGKVDRGALPEPESTAYAHFEYEAPLGSVEQVMAQIWKELLRLDRVGRQDDFFSLGGHSLLAVRMISRVRERLGLELRLADLFAGFTLAQIVINLKAAGESQADRIVPAGHRSMLELSFAQQRLFFLSQVSGAGAAYHIPWGLQLVGELDRAALQKALTRIVQRHEALRTSFPMKDGQAIQSIKPADTYAFELHEEEIMRPRALGADAMRNILMQEGKRPFDLLRGPLIRGMLIRREANVHTLLITMHHIVSDGWSIGVFLRELSALYSAFRAGMRDPLPPLRVQYADYAAWQRRWLGGTRLEKLKQYWRETLTGAPALLELPTDHPRPEQQRFAGGFLALQFDEKLTASLRELARCSGSTLFMTLLAGWAVLLKRLSRQQDLVIGTPVAGRGRIELEPLIGFFVNTLALRLDLARSPTVHEFLQQVKMRTIQAHEHQDLPFQQVVECLKPVRNMAYSPLFQVMFAWQATADDRRLELPALQVSTIEAIEPNTAQFDLTLELADANERIVGGIEYSSSLFEPETIARYARYLETLLKAMVADPTRHVDELALLADEERRKVLVDWNSTTQKYSTEKRLHRVFEEQVRRTPNAVAAICDGTQVTYSRLNADANRLANYLHQFDLNPDACVAVCVERGVAMIVAIIAVLKAGAAYVPLDPQYPIERLAFMLTDSQPRVLLTDSASSEKLSRACLAAVRDGIAVIDLSRDASEFAALGADDLPEVPGGATSRSLAYVIYTSGSTGSPKGVMVEHRSVVNLISAAQSRYSLGEGDVTLQQSSLSFDTAVSEIYWPLSQGVTLIVATREDQQDPVRLARLIAEHRITVAQFTPMMLSLFVEQADPPTLPTLKYVISGGEELPTSFANRFCSRFPATALSNVYGPTEATVDATSFSCCDRELAGLVVPIGRPISNARVYVLNEAKEPVPVGVTGEIFIGGDGLARGYLNRPDLTSERFVKSPIWSDERLYRSGDLGRYLPDGNIQFLGRNDNQVKIRGFRIELGEIEAALTRHELVKEAVVLVRDDPAGGKQLVAYLTHRRRKPRVEELREHLRTLLPEFMVPGVYVLLESLPISPTGKIDRQALPNIAPQASTTAYEAPNSETEKTLAAIWQELLQVDRVGRHDNLFELGGHSVLMIQLSTRVRNEFDVPFAAGVLFTAHTLSKLASHIDALRRKHPT